ncbi:MAG TPA: nuclear transport factor 2 family protein [Gammaproteobacteria bacterium]|nr:nuclear transport factor 2 family protein [Gammaproteobacteria bacterium]
MSKLLLSLALWVPAASALAETPSACPADAAVVAALDTEYQAAVERKDAAAMGRLLADDFTLVTSSGAVYHKADLLAQDRDDSLSYEHQSDTRQTVRFWNNTAVITALLWIKGSYQGTALDYTLWFSDVYVCTAKGWRYSFGQAGGRIPKTP